MRQRAAGRFEVWFHKWWRRYREAGPEGLYDLTRARHAKQRILPELERTILSVRRRLQAHATSATRNSLVWRLRLRKLPASFVVPTGRQKLAAGRVTFLRRVSAAGTVGVLSQTYRVGKRHRGLYLRLVVDTGRGWLTAYLNGRVLKRWPYKLLNDKPTPERAAAVGSNGHPVREYSGRPRTLRTKRCTVGSQLGPPWLWGTGRRKRRGFSRVS
jgi:hypothetical protein